MPEPVQVSGLLDEAIDERAALPTIMYGVDKTSSAVSDGSRELLIRSAVPWGVVGHHDRLHQHLQLQRR
jgi:hypothetical protein